MCDPGDQNEMACVYSGQGKRGCIRSWATHLRRAGLVLQAHAPIHLPVVWDPVLSCVAMVDVVRHGHFRRGHWEVLELGGSLGMGTLSQEFLSPNLSLGFQVALPWET